MSALAGKRIVNTRAVHQAGELDALLLAHGAIPIAYPCIAIEPPADTAELDRALLELLAGEFDWLAITSANTVPSMASRLAALRVCDSKPLQNGSADTLQCVPTSRLAVVGPGTAEAAWRELGLRADVVPPTYRAADLATAMPVEPGQRVLIPQSEIASPGLANGLRAQGAEVTTVTAYRTVTGSGGVDLPALLARGEVDAIVFASSSAVDGFFARLEGTEDRGQGTGGTGGGDQRSASINHRPSTIGQFTTVCIGPGTARAAFAHGLLAPIIPAEQTLAGIIDALETEFAALSKGLVS